MSTLNETQFSFYPDQKDRSKLNLQKITGKIAEGGETVLKGMARFVKIIPKRVEVHTEPAACSLAIIKITIDGNAPHAYAVQGRLDFGEEWLSVTGFLSANDLHMEGTYTIPG